MHPSPLRHLWQWVSALAGPPAHVPHRPSASAGRHPSLAEATQPASRLPPPAGPRQDETGWTMQIREDLAAVIYESCFPSLSWGDATPGARQSAYAGAEAVLDVLAALEREPPLQS